MEVGKIVCKCTEMGGCSKDKKDQRVELRERNNERGKDTGKIK